MCFCLILSWVTRVPAQDLITVQPNEYANALCNPLKGLRPNLDLSRLTNTDYPFNSIVRHYIKWSEIESDETDDYTKLVEYANSKWSQLPSLNIKVIPRVYIDWDIKQGNEFWPADILQKTGLKPDDPELWRTQIVKDRLVALIHKMGQAWNNDHRIAWIQTGLVGYWGEQENPVGVDEENYAKILGDAFQEAFPNKKLVVRNQNPWDKEGHKWGVYWDSYGHPGQKSGAWSYIQYFNSQNRYLREIVEGEVAYNWGESVFDPIYGGEPNITLGNNQYTNNMIDVIRELHASGLGWIASYTLDGAFNTDPNVVKMNAERIQKALGYRFILSEFSCSARTLEDRSLNINFKVKNEGSAPFYQSWPIALVLIDESTQEIAWKKILSGIDVTSWLPGENYDYNNRVYEIPVQEYAHNLSVTIPESVNSGQYLVGLSILEPYSETPGVFFAIENFLAASQTQPLMRIGIGEDMTGEHVINIPFDDPIVDDMRFYTTTPIGPMHTLSTFKTTGGSISPAEGYYNENTTVSVAAIPNLGYEFSGWNGDLLGSINPTSLIMNSDKTVSADFVYVGLPVYDDKIHNLNAPSAVSPGEEVNVSIEYEASDARDIRVFLQMNSSPWTIYGSKRIGVWPGSRTYNIAFTVSPVTPLATDAYKIVANLLPPGGIWADRFDEISLLNVDAIESLSTKESNKFGITIYPNPTDSFITIKSEKTLGSIALYSLSGKLLWDKKLQTNNYKLNLFGFSKGLYFLNINNVDGYFNTKLILI